MDMEVVRDYQSYLPVHYGRRGSHVVLLELPVGIKIIPRAIIIGLKIIGIETSGIIYRYNRSPYNESMSSLVL
jgi:hypothetical protein